MRSLVLSLLHLVASAFAWSIVSPNTAQGWSAVGSQKLSWVASGNDPVNFTVVLNNGNAALLPNGPQVLAALVVGSLGNTSVNPPSNGWPTGEGFRVQLAASATELNTVIAESSVFAIGVVNTTSSAVKSSTAGLTSTPTVPTNTPVNIPSKSTNASPTDPLGQDNAAPATLSVHTGLMALAAMIGFFCA